MNHTTDYRSNENDQIAYAAKKISDSPLKKMVFKAVYFGKKSKKTVQEICDATDLKRKQVLDAAKKMVTAKIIHQTKIDGTIYYEKDSAYQGTWKKILSYSNSPKKLSSLPTKVNPSIKVVGKSISLKIPSNQVKTKQITVDDITSFSLVKKNLRTKSNAAKSMPEKVFKEGLLKILKEKGNFKDWGGETNDIYTNKMQIGPNRVHAAFALKGPGQKTPKLTPKHMGKNGDQIQRLASSPAEVLIVQYWGEIDQSVVELLRTHAIAKSYSGGQLIYYGIIDGEDSNRIISSYPKAFKRK